MFTDAQKFIIRQVCSIQFKSLEDILIKTDLGINGEGEKYSDIFAEYEISRKEFDEQLIKTYKKFQEIENEPDKLFELDELDFLVFKHILYAWEGDWIDKYPKAIKNLWNRILIYELNHGINLLNHEQNQN